MLPTKIRKTECQFRHIECRLVLGPDLWLRSVGEPEREARASYVGKRLKFAGDYMLPFVRPLAIEVVGQRPIEPAGSCVLLWHRGRRYAVTAAHVVENIDGKTVMVSTEDAWIDLPHPWCVTEAPKTGRGDDRIDIGFRFVSDAEAAAFGSCDFLRASQTEGRSTEHSNAVFRRKYIVCGFPKTKFKYNPNTNVAKHQSAAIAINEGECARYESLGVEPETHVVLDLENSRVHRRDGELQDLPSLNCVSGGGMIRWKAAEHYGSVELPQLAAVAVEHYERRNLVVGVRLSFVRKIIDGAIAQGRPGTE